jgi:hypothetical protein
MSYRYARAWSWRKRRGTRTLDEPEARRRHEAGQLYTVVVGDEEPPEAYLDVHLALGFVGVMFLDDQARPELSYGFWTEAHRPPRPGELLFLQHVGISTYAEDADVLEIYETLQFDPRGKVVVTRDHKRVQVRETREQTVAVDAHWEPVPAFGNYARILRRERG